MRRVIVIFLVLTLLLDFVILALYYLDHRKLSGVANDVQEIPDNDEIDVGIDDDRMKNLQNLVRGLGDLDSVNKKVYVLSGKNPDCIGWLSIPDTVIDYPVMYTPDNAQKYIHLSFKENYSFAGCLFADTFCTPCGSNRSTNVIIYGHNMKSGDMFHALLNYENAEYYANHRYINWTTIEGMAVYEIFAAFRTTSDSEVYSFIDAQDELVYNSFIADCKSKTPYDTCAVDSGTDLLTLSTCAYHITNGRFVVLAKKISEN